VLSLQTRTAGWENASVTLTSSNAVSPAERVSKVLYGGLPYLVLASSTIIAAVSAAKPGSPHVLITAGLAVLAGVWLIFPLIVLPTWPRHRVSITIFYVGLLVIAAVLLTRSGAYALFAALGYTYAVSLLPPRFIVWAVTATALTTAIGQSLSPDSRSLGSRYLLAVDIAVPLIFVGWYIGRQSERRSEVIAELEALNRRLEDALKENVGLHAQLLQQAREAGMMEERQRMAREIHDTTAQGLAGIVTQLQAADLSADDHGARQRHLGNAMRLARQSLAETRRSMRAMPPGVLEASPLPEALGIIVSEWSALHDAVAELTVTGTWAKLDPEIEVTLLRAAQEALANVGKHARATRVRLTLTYFDDLVSLDVRDDGVGFDPEPASPAPGGSPGSGGVGLIGMRARLERLAGTLNIESAPGAGCALSASVPALGPDAPGQRDAS
jgi:signal transduction histidine kinase